MRAGDDALDHRRQARPHAHFQRKAPTGSSIAADFKRLAGGGGGAMALELVSFAVGAVVFGVLYHLLVQRVPRIAGLMPLASMAGIVYFTTVTTAAGRDNLLLVGGILVLVAMLHNTAGYFFGYWLARLCRLDHSSCRTVAIEVGLQNGGMASGLAGHGQAGDSRSGPGCLQPLDECIRVDSREPLEEAFGWGCSKE